MKVTLALILLLFSYSFSQNIPFKTYYNNGKIESEINYVNNIREGEAKFYYESGNLKEERTYVNGRVDGLVKIYSDSGKLKEVINIENGKREGPTSLFNEEGIYITDLFFSQGKRVIEEAPYQEETPSTELAVDGRDKEEENIAPPKVIKPKMNTSGMPLPPSIEEDLENDPAVFLTAEIMPEPEGGMETIYKKLVYPDAAIKNNIEGTVKILASIDEYGEVTKAEVIEGIGYGCDEAARFAVFYTKFKPAVQKGKPVNIQTIIPVEFKIKEELIN